MNALFSLLLFLGTHQELVGQSEVDARGMLGQPWVKQSVGDQYGTETVLIYVQEPWCVWVCISDKTKRIEQVLSWDMLKERKRP